MAEDIDAEAQILIAWIKTGLRATNRKQADLSRHLGIPPSRMSEIMHGRRRISAVELQRTSVFLGSPIPRSIRPLPGIEIGEVVVMGKIDKAWVEDGETYPRKRNVGAILDPRWPAQHQLAFDCELTDASIDIKHGDLIIGVGIIHVPVLTTDQLVVIERRMSGLFNYALGRVTDGASRSYELVSKPPPGKHSAEIVALVIATQRPR